MTTQIEALKLSPKAQPATLNGNPVLVRISAVDMQAYVIFPHRRVEDEYGNVSYVGDILSAKDAHLRGMHLRLLND